MVSVMSGEIADGDAITLPDGSTERVAGIFTVYGESQAQGRQGCRWRCCLPRPARQRRSAATSSAQTALRANPERAKVTRPPVYSLAVETQNRADDVKLASAMARLLDEDGALDFGPDCGDARVPSQGAG